MRLQVCKRGVFLYNKNDRVIGRSLESCGEWADTELELLEPFLAMGDTVLDVGANIGTHTVFFAKNVAPSGKVIAIEPQRLIFQTLCANLALNALKNVTALQAACGERLGKASIPELDPELPYNFGALGLDSIALQEGKEVISVPLITIDSLELSSCALIKVDVEGYESNVLQGAAKTIERLQPVLFIENHDEEKAPRLQELVLNAGYRCFWHFAGFNFNNYFGFKEDFSQGYIEVNLLCIPPALDLEDYDLSALVPLSGKDDTPKSALQRRH